MKKSYVVLMALCASVLVACGDKKEETHTADVAQPSVLPVAADRTANGEVPALARKYNCTACHAIDKKVVGPAWMEVSRKYKGDAGAEARLIAKVSKGGSGVWGSIPMPGNDVAGVHQADMQELVKFVLGLAK